MLNRTQYLLTCLSVLMLVGCNQDQRTKATPSPHPYVKGGKPVVMCYHANGEKPHGSITVNFGNAAVVVTCDE